jgi:hypothetical protein
VVISFGPNYSYTLLKLLYGDRHSDGETSAVLRYYCVYIITLAMNGTSTCVMVLFYVLNLITLHLRYMYYVLTIGRCLFVVLSDLVSIFMHIVQ